MNEEMKNVNNIESMGNILVHTPAKNKYAAASEVTRKGKGKQKESPTRRLWPEEWKMDELFAAQDSSDSDSLADCESALAFGTFDPVYRRAKLGFFVS